ncbi:flavin-containing monooxygenase, partial [Nocardioides marmoraquaticus]
MSAGVTHDGVQADAKAAAVLHTAVVGAGFSGIGAAIKLREAGLDDFVVLEAGDGVGGTWHWNTYPGVAVDIPSFSYQFSFAQRSTWTRTYAPGDELKQYAEWLVERYALTSRIRLSTHVVRAVWEKEQHLWRLELDDGATVRARFLINGSGVLTTPKAPDLPGIDTFRGTTVHTARWDHDLDLSGQRVAVIGTGASAIQLIPAIAEQVDTLTVFQRTPIWCLPKPDLPVPRWVQRALSAPGGRSATRLISQGFVEMCRVPGLMEALIPRKDESHGSTEEVSRGASGTG